jgi:hypothetical protein
LEQLLLAEALVAQQVQTLALLEVLAVVVAITQAEVLALLVKVTQVAHKAEILAIIHQAAAVAQEPLAVQVKAQLAHLALVEMELLQP